jgi:hypothetical protein
MVCHIDLFCRYGLVALTMAGVAEKVQLCLRLMLARGLDKKAAQENPALLSLSNGNA